MSIAHRSVKTSQARASLILILATVFMLVTVLIVTNMKRKPGRSIRDVSTSLLRRKLRRPPISVPGAAVLAAVLVMVSTTSALGSRVQSAASGVEVRFADLDRGPPAGQANAFAYADLAVWELVVRGERRSFALALGSVSNYLPPPRTLNGVATDAQAPRYTENAGCEGSPAFQAWLWSQRLALYVFPLSSLGGDITEQLTVQNFGWSVDVEIVDVFPSLNVGVLVGPMVPKSEACDVLDQWPTRRPSFFEEQLPVALTIDRDEYVFRGSPELHGPRGFRYVEALRPPEAPDGIGHIALPSSLGLQDLGGILVVDTFEDGVGLLGMVTEVGLSDVRFVRSGKLYQLIQETVLGLADQLDGDADFGFSLASGTVLECEVGDVEPDAPSVGKILELDEILAVGGESIRSRTHCRKALADAVSGSSIELQVRRRGVVISINIRSKA